MYPIYAKILQDIIFLNNDNPERLNLIKAGLLWRVGDYVLMPSLNWWVTYKSPFNVPDNVEGFRFTLWYARNHPDFLTLPLLPTVDPELKLESNSKLLFTYYDLEESNQHHLIIVRNLAPK